MIRREWEKEGFMVGVVIWFAALAVLFYTLIVRPQRRRSVAHQLLVSNLKVGDEVVTSGGIHGRITKVDEGTAHLEIATNTVIAISKQAIVQIHDSELQSK